MIWIIRVSFILDRNGKMVDFICFVPIGAVSKICFPSSRGNKRKVKGKQFISFPYG